MIIEDFIARLEEEFDDLQPGVLKPETHFREVFEWNSINALILIALVKTEYDVTINAADIQSSKSIQDLFSVLTKKMN
jgi:acyl carrier protein